MHRYSNSRVDYLTMNLDGTSIIIKKRANNPILREDVDALRSNVSLALEKREKSLAKEKELSKEVEEIKKKSIKNLEDLVFGAAKSLRESGRDAFIAKRPLDVAEYIRGIVEKEALGLVPSPQTIESEVMQAFFVSNGIRILSEKYAGIKGGTPMLHPYLPYPNSEEKADSSEGLRFAIVSACILDSGGFGYFEEEEIKALENCKDSFVIVSADRVFGKEDAAKVARLLELSSGEMIKTKKVELPKQVIILDNGRLNVARSERAGVLKCIGCYACSIYDPVFLTIGSIYGSPQMGEIGVVSAGYQSGLKTAVSRGLWLSPLSKRSESECPVNVPLTAVLVQMRQKAELNGL